LLDTACLSNSGVLQFGVQLEIIRKNLLLSFSLDENGNPISEVQFCFNSLSLACFDVFMAFFARLPI
jgi:hypothetical protein